MSGTTTDAGKLLIAVEATTENLKRQLDQALAAVDSATQGMKTSVDRANTAFDSMGTAVEKSISVVEKFASSLSPAAGEAVKFFTAIASGAAIGTVVGNLFTKLASGAGELAKSFVEAGDEHKIFLAQLEAITGSASQAEAAFSKLEAITLQTGVAASTSTEMFKKLSVATAEIGTSNADVLTMVKTLEEAGVAAGATSDQVKTVAQSLAVGFESGTINARQFRTIIVEMPQLAEDMATALGKTVPQLMDMAKHGQLTADVLQQGILGATTAIEIKFNAMPLSLNRAWGELLGGVTEFLAQLDKLTGVSKLVAEIWERIGKGAHAAAVAIGSGTDLEKSTASVEKLTAKYDELQTAIEKEKAAAAKETKPSPEIAGLMQQDIKGSASVSQDNPQGLTNLQQMQKDAAEVYKELQKELAAKKELALQAHQDLMSDNSKRAAEGLAALQGHQADAVTKIMQNDDRKLAIETKYQADRKAIVDAAASGAIDPQTEEAALADVEKAHTDALNQLAKAQDGANRKAEEAAKRAQDVADASSLAAQKAKDLFDAYSNGADATEKANVDAQINNDLKKAGLTDTLNLTQAQWDLRDSIINSDKAQGDWNEKLKDAKAATEAHTKAVADATHKAEEYQRELEQTTKDIATQISSSLYDELTNAKKGQSFLDYFKGLFKKLAVEAATANIVLPIIAPIVQAGAGLLGVGQAGGGNQIFNAAGQVIGTVGGMAGGSAPSGGSGGLMGSGSVLSNLFSAGSLANTVSGGSIFSSIGSSLGLTGPGNLLGSGGFLGSGGAVSSFLASGIGGTSTAEAAASAASNAFAPAATGLFGGASVGSALGGVGAGFAAGTLLNSLVGGKQVGGTIGSGVGAVAGTVAGLALTPILGPFGPLIGGLVGGAAGGGLGGLIGPGPKNQYSDINVGTSGGLIDITKAIGNDKGTQDLITATANSAAAANALATQFGLAISGGQWIGKGISAPVGPDAAFNLGKFQFSATGSTDPGLNAALAQQGGVFQSTDDLQKFITFVTQSYGPLQKTADATNQFDQQIDAINKTYADAIATAQSYGLATDKLVATQQDAVTKINAAHQAAINQLQAGADISLLTAQGRTFEAQTYGLGSGKQAQLDDLTKQLTDLGLSAADAAPWVDKLSQAIDLQIQSIRTANALQIATVEAQSQIDAKTAFGLTSAAAQQKAWIDNAAAIKSLTDTLTGLGVSASDAQPYIDNLTNALAAQTQAQQAATNDTLRDLQVQTQLRYENALGVNDPAMKATADLGTLIESQYEDAQKLYNQMVSLGATTDQVTQALGVLSAAQKIERDNLTQQATATNTAGASIQQYLDKLNQTSAGGASPVNQYAAAKQVFGDQLALAQGGNADALSNITSNADALLAAAKGMFGSGQGYQDVVSFVKSSLTGLPATTSYEAQVLAALKDLGGSINVDVSLDVIRSIKETLEALPASEANKLQVAETILHTVEETMGKQLTTAQFDELLTVQGMDGTVIQIVNQQLNGLTPAALEKIEEIAGLDPTVAQKVVQDMQSLTKVEFENIATVAGVDPQTIQSLEQKMGSLSSAQFAQIATVAGVDPTVLQHLAQTMGPLTKTEFDQIAQVAGIDPKVIQAVDQQLTALTPAQFADVAALDGLDPTITQTVKQLLYALGSSDWQQIAAAEHIDPSVVQKVSQILQGLTPDQLAQIQSIADLPANVLTNITQNLKTTGSTEITPDPITKQITQNVDTNEAVVVHISDTLSGVFNLMYLQQGQMITYLFNIQQNTFDAARGSYGFAKGGVFPFARGGVVSVPTYAPIALFGEAGPEAIMPLRRDASGRLGVSANTGNDDSGADTAAAIGQVGIVLRDEMRAMRGDIQDMRAVLRRAVAA